MSGGEGVGNTRKRSRAKLKKKMAKKDHKKIK